MGQTAISDRHSLPPFVMRLRDGTTLYAIDRLLLPSPPVPPGVREFAEKRALVLRRT